MAAESGGDRERSRKAVRRFRMPGERFGRNFGRTLHHAATPRVIAVCGAKRGAGTTLLTLSLAAYFAKHEALKTAVIEVGSREAFCRMATKAPVLRAPLPGFRCEGVDLFPGVPPKKLTALLSMHYDRMVIDVQEASHMLTLTAGFERTLFLGGTAPWEYEDLERLMKMLLENSYDLSRGLYFGRNAETESCSRFYETFGQRLYPVPVLTDAFCPEEKICRWLRMLEDRGMI